MLIKTKKIKSTQNKNKKNKAKKTRKSKRFLKAGSNEKCCICGKKIVGKSFIPSECLMKHGKIRSHKICNDCWWNSFAIEGANHKCPGCIYKKPLNDQKQTELIDLTKEED
jgi:hypothetical protein